MAIFSRVPLNTSNTGSDRVVSDNRGDSSIGLGSSSSASNRDLDPESLYLDHLESSNPYKGTPFESQYLAIIQHYQLLISKAEANKKWYENIGLSRYTEQLIAQYTADMYAELRSLESEFRNFELNLPENIVELQNRAGLNSDLIGLQYGSSGVGSGSGSGSVRSSSLPSSSPASEALTMGLSMIGAIKDFATLNIPSLISSIGQIRGVSLDNDLKKQQLASGKFNQYALENEYLREFALNSFGSTQYDDDEVKKAENLDRLQSFLNLSMDEKRKISDLPSFLDDDRANSYLSQYVNSSNFDLDRQAVLNGTLKLSRENAYLSETYGSDFTSMTEFYKILGPLLRDLEELTARFNLEQSSYDFNTVSSDVTSDIGVDGSLSFVEEPSDFLDPEIAAKAVNAGNDRSYYQNQFEGDVKEVMQKHTSEWSKKAESSEWWSWIYDLLIMALPQFIQGLSSGSISLFRGGSTTNNVSYDYGTKDIVSNRYFNGVSE